MADGPHEIELKFALPGGREDRLLAALPELAGAKPHPLHAVYFDTRKRALRRARMVLRVRREGGRYVQTLKTAGDGALKRGEWEEAVAGADPVLDRLAKTPAAAILKRDPKLAPQFTIEVGRRRIDALEGASRIEVALDAGAAKAGAKRAAFAELELELKSGPIDGLFALARRLAAAAGLTLSFTTKAERGFALAAPTRGRAKRFEAPALTKTMTAGEAFRAAAYASLRQIAGNAEQLRVRASPEVIHQLRVGLRRLRSLITTFKDVVDDARLPAIKAELKWLTGELDGARNLDVLLQGDYRTALLQKEDAEGLKGLGARLRAARRLAYARAAAAAESERFRALLLDLLIWIEAGPWSGYSANKHARERPVARFAAKALSARRRKIEKGGAKLRSLDADDRHKLRIEAKKLRYAADVFAGLFERPKRARAFVAALKAVQDDLGALNDIVVGDRLSHEAAQAAGWAETDAAFVAGRIAGAQKARVGPLMSKAEAALAAFGEVKEFW